MPPAPDDEYLVARARQGYLDAFEMLVLRHRDRVYRIALRMLGDPHEAEDVAQEALVQAWRGLPGFSGSSAFGTWLYRIVINRCLNVQRARRPTRPLADLDLAGGPRPDEVVEAEGRRSALRTAIAHLPAEQRAPLVLYQFEDFSYDEVATMLDITPAAVRGRIYRARRELVELMRGWE